MRKLFLTIGMIISGMALFAQLPYDTEMTKDEFNNPYTVSAPVGNVSWGKLDLFDLNGMIMGKLIIIGDAQDHYAIVSLPKDGIPDKVFFTYYGASTNGTMSIAESSDSREWIDCWSKTKIEMKVIKDSVSLKKDTRFLRFKYSGKSYVLFNAITVKEKKSVAVNLDEWQFHQAKVDDAAEQKEVTVTWTNLVANVTSTNPAFTVNLATIGQKNLENQTTKLIISYNHDNYGSHEGEIILEGEGRKATIKVSGTTTRYPQTLTWNDNLGTYKTTDNISLNAFTDQAQPVTYTSSDSTIAYVDEANHIVVVCAGTVDITAFHPGDRKFEPTNKITKSVTFVKDNPNVSITANKIVYGQTLAETNPVETIGDIPGTIVFKKADPSAVLDADTYTLAVVFMPDDSCIWNNAERNVTIVVEKAHQTIEWNQEETTLYVDDKIILTAKASSGLPMTYAFTDCNIYIEGSEMTGIEEGDVLVIAFQAGNKNYYPSTVAMQAFEVLGKEVPTAERRVEVSLDELEQNGKKYYHNGEVYIYYQAHIYTADGKVIK